MKQLKRVGLLVWIGISASLIAVGMMTVLQWTATAWPVGLLSSKLTAQWLPFLAMQVALLHVGVMLVTMIPRRRPISRAGAGDSEHSAMDEHLRG